MTFEQWKTIVDAVPIPVILLEGIRDLPQEDYVRLEKAGAALAQEFPAARFRSGNATGSDAAFARGVAKVDASRLELVVPYATHRKAERPTNARILSLSELTNQDELTQQTVLASPQYQWLAQNKGQKSQAKLSYLLRDTLKINGVSELGFAPVTSGLFYINTQKPDSGGTAHTIRVCRMSNIPVLTQEAWLNWQF